MFCCRLALAGVVAALALASPAHASFWLQCRVKADIATTETAGHYRLTVHEAVTTDGHVEKGEPCIPQHIDQTITVAIDGNVPQGKNKTLRYEYYNARTPDGVVNSETWTAPTFFERIF